MLRPTPILRFGRPTAIRWQNGRSKDIYAEGTQPKFDNSYGQAQEPRQWSSRENQYERKSWPDRQYDHQYRAASRHSRAWDRPDKGIPRDPSTAPPPRPKGKKRSDARPYADPYQSGKSFAHGRRRSQTVAHRFEKGVRNTGRPQYAAARRQSDVPWQPGQDDFSRARRYDAQLDDIKVRSGGALFHRTILDNSNQSNLRPLGDVRAGDFVEVQKNQTLQGVVISFEQYATTHNTDNDLQRVQGQRQSAILLVTGEVKMLNLTDFVIAFPAFVDADLVDSATVKPLPIAPGKDQPTNATEDGVLERFDERTMRARAQICAKLRHLLHSAEMEMQRFTPPFERRFLSETSDLSTTQPARMSLTEILQQLLQDLRVSEQAVAVEVNAPEKLYAVHRLVSSVPDVFHLDPTSHRFTNSFTRLGEEHRQILQNVTSQTQSSLQRRFDLSTGIQGNAEVIEEFAARTRRRIAARKEASDKLAPPLDQPQMAKVSLLPDLAWTQADRDVLLFLRSALGIRHNFAGESTRGLYLHILKRCGYALEMEPDQLDEAMNPNINGISMQKTLIVRLLSDLGLLAPWDNVANLDNELQSVLDQTDAVVSGPSHAQPHLTFDQDDHLRKDVHASVYVIDDVGAEELDDGISIESTEDPDQVWVHVHVADPTAALQPDAPEAVAAARRVSSLYAPEHTWPMLPKGLVNQVGMRIDPTDSGQAQPRRALTFSARLHRITGAAIDVQVGLTSLHNIQQISYDEATDKIRNGDGTDAAVDQLRQLFELARTLERRRVQKGGAIVTTGSSNPGQVRITPQPLPTSPIRSMTFADQETFAFGGFPRIQSQSQEGMVARSASVVDARGLISEFAIMAGRVVARWMQDNKAPTLFRSQGLGQTKEADLARLYAIREEDGTVDMAKLLQAGMQFGSAMVSTRPDQHITLGILTQMALATQRQGGADAADPLLSAGYVRATSPLRRFTDLMMHWQIRAVLRRGSNKPTFPFSEERLRSMLPRLVRDEGWIRNMQLSSNTFWAGLRVHLGFLARLSEAERQRRANFDQYAAILTKVPYDAAAEPDVEAILDQTQEALVHLGDVRTLANGDLSIAVQLQSCGLRAQCHWERHYGNPKLGSVLPVRLVDSVFSGTAPVLSVKRIDV